MIIAENISRVYDGVFPVRAVDGLSLEVADGEFLCLAGPSGSGKTTLLHLLGGLERPDSGRIAIDGEEITGYNQRQRARLRLWKIGFIFQELNLIPVLNARENVEYGLLLQGVVASERRRRVDEILAELDLAGLAERRPRALSRGQQQRVAVARAMVSRPKLVIADEPTANLDSHNAENLVELMRRLNRDRGVTIVMATHDQQIMKRVGRVVSLRDGQITGETK
ncbi:MAG TPA: ABC transporter ATP-binding protein [bacterium]|uniref:ABC transporter ATP-binding protein YtrE n=1 Tax=candidate division TA06 bacterium ADurb.Bin417 TaxID=1852828 RepID=A0A1V5M8D7_UNCT6|nr:MAG: ABC transporter ATP-binding protein YtrE [candidate division TA06 bacterium ADurb.Bin417]HNQ35816.1 ABC transporter ATP-binding protein [bacterium]HNS49217.1 ABC transporter ATP-binding protein [bacterium]